VHSSLRVGWQTGKTSQKKKGSQSRLIEEIAKGNQPPPKRAHDNAMVVDEEEEDEVMVSYDVGDDAVVGAVVAGEEKTANVKANKAARKAAKTKKDNEPKKAVKTSPVWTMFRSTETEYKMECRFHKFSKSGHPQFVMASNGRTSNLLEHARLHHKDVLEGIIKCNNCDSPLSEQFDFSSLLDISNSVQAALDENDDLDDGAEDGPVAMDVE